MLTLSPTNPLVFTSPADRYTKNIAALTLLRHLQADERLPASLTDDERRILAHYSAFANADLLNRFLHDPQIMALTSQAERAAVQRTALTAYYTAQPVLHAMWDVLAPRLAYHDQLRILEPAVGAAGMCVATMPADLRARAAITAIELDQISSQIVGFLHPDLQLHAATGFEDVPMTPGSYDLVISNVPFSEVRVFDPHVTPLGRHLTQTLHDFFLVKSLLAVRPGGVVAILTSYGTLAKRDPRVRAWLATQADLLAAIKLPHGVFAANAGTACGTDLLILRRRAAQTPATDVAWTTTELINLPVQIENGQHFTSGSRLRHNSNEDDADLTSSDTIPVRVNAHFLQHPDQIIGQQQVVWSNNCFWLSVTPPRDRDVADLLRERLAAVLPAELLTPTQPVSTQSPARHSRSAVESPRATALLAVYAAAQAVLALDARGEDASDARSQLNDCYDQVRAVYGPLRTRANQQALRGTAELLFLNALESVTVHGETRSYHKAAIFDGPTIRATPQALPGSMSAGDALLYSLNTVGCVDLDTIAHAAGLTTTAIIDALTGVIYHNPETGTWETADQYLSGNVRSKLASARQAATQNPLYANHVQALEAVLPSPIPPTSITAFLGSPWLPAAVVQSFIQHLLPTFGRGEVRYSPVTAQWRVADQSGAAFSHEATVVWGTSRIHAIDLLELTLNSQAPTIYDEDSHGNRTINQQETLLARAKQAALNEAWSSWVWADPIRASELASIYNERFNSMVVRDYHGAHLTLPGINTAILRTGDLDAHQKDAVWMILQQQAVLTDIPTGGGKTFTALAAVHELKRLGFARRCVIITETHLVEQWLEEANRLYPTLRVLGMAPNEFADKAKRGTFLGKLMTEAYDVAILAHTSFGLIDPGAIERDFVALEIESLRDHLLALTGGERSRLTARMVKEIEKRIAKLESQLRERAARSHDSQRIVTWETLGIDALFVDEAQCFKNLFVPTSMGSIPGVPRGDSKRAFDFRIKSWDILRRGGRLVLMTATPIMNTIGEAFIMQTYLQHDLLVELGINQFDAWARTFAQTVTNLEMTPDGSGFRLNTRLARFVNLPELFQLWFQVTLARSKQELGLPLPKRIGGKIIPIQIPASPELKTFTHQCAERMQRVRRGSVDPTQDNILKIISDGTKAALDPRLVGLPAPAVSKIDVLADYVAALYHQYDAAKATQLIYCELGTPHR